MSTIKNNINTYADLTAYNADTNKEYPNVSYIQGTDNVIWEKEEPTPVAGPDLIVEGNASGGAMLMLQNREGEESPTFTNWFDSITMDGDELNLEEIDSNVDGVVYDIPDGEHRFEFFVKKVNGAMPFTDLGCIMFDGMALSSYIAGEGFTDITDVSNQASFNLYVQGNVVLPSTLTHIGYNPADYMNGIIECTSLTLKYNGVISCANEVEVYDEETEQETLQTIVTYPIYTNLYVPSNQVNAYTADNWQNVSPIV